MGDGRDWRTEACEGPPPIAEVLAFLTPPEQAGILALPNCSALPLGLQLQLWPWFPHHPGICLKCKVPKPHADMLSVTAFNKIPLTVVPTNIRELWASLPGCPASSVASSQWLTLSERLKNKLFR